MQTNPETADRDDRKVAPRRREKARSRGQILVLFVMAIFVFTGMVALVIDLSWYWVNSLRIQRAADAAALAGVVQLPGNPGTAYSLARAEAAKNGYDDATAAVVIIPQQDPPGTGRRLVVTVQAPINTFFMRIFGINSIPASRTAKAEFVLPVPMGSPENYYGVFGLVRGATSTSTVTNTVVTDATNNTGFHVATGAPSGGQWTRSNSDTIVEVVSANDNDYAQEDTNGQAQQWDDFVFTSGGSQIPAPAANQTVQIDGIEVRLTDTFLSASCSNSRVRAELSWANGAAGTWSTAVDTPNLNTTSGADYTLPSSGGTTSTAAWGTHAWIRSDFTNANFRVRLTAVKGCATAGTLLRVDRLEVRVTYTVYTTTTTTSTVTTNLPDIDLQGPGTACVGVASCFDANGAVLNPRGFWATMNTQGSANVNGDAFQPYYDTVGGATNPAHDPVTYYNYAFEMPAGSSGGSVYIYDPVFCATAVNRGVGDRWFSGAGDPVSSFFELYDTQNTLYDMADDGAAIATSGGLFRNMSASDTSMGGTSSGSPAQCRSTTDAAYGDARDYHLHWYLLASGLSGGPNGKIYRLHTTSTDPANAAAQRGTDGANSYALYGSATGGTPRFYGLGAMQMFTPLSSTGGTVSSEFYLAQIEAAHAGKQVEIQLWDPGDTSPLGANLQILVPNSGGWSATNVNYTAARGTTNGGAANCNSLTGTGVGSITTNVGATAGTFNGCWLTIVAQIPTTYTGAQQGWWKIRYNMSGSGTSNDVTTWKVNIRGNPVHLIVP